MNKLIWVGLVCAFVALQYGVMTTNNQVRDLTASLESTRAELVELAKKQPEVVVKMPPGQTSADASQAYTNLRNQIHEAAKRLGSDKSTIHAYDYLYPKYLPYLMKYDKIKIMEIGYGCDFPNPGGSMRLWREILKDRLDLHLIEYDGKCIEANKQALKDLGVTAYVGDQTDRTFLRDFITKSGGNFHMIIDDGGHTMNQQRVSIEELYKAVVPGGFYAVEDLQTSFWPSYIDKGPLMTNVFKGYLDFLMSDQVPEAKLMTIVEDKEGNTEYVKGIQSFECMRELCIITKKM
jgi:hypothetical protein